MKSNQFSQAGIGGIRSCFFTIDSIEIIYADLSNQTVDGLDMGVCAKDEQKVWKVLIHSQDLFAAIQTKHFGLGLGIYLY